MCPLLSQTKCVCWESQGSAGWRSPAEPLPEVKSPLSQGAEHRKVFEVPHPMSDTAHPRSSLSARAPWHAGGGR